jgi:hypothetical protein
VQAYRLATRVHDLAADCERALGPAVATMSGGAWTGGVSDAFLADLHGQQRALRAALADAVASVDSMVVEVRAGEQREADRLEAERREREASSP